MCIRQRQMNSKISFLFLLQATINVVNLALAQTPSSGTQQVFSCRNLGDYSSESHQKQRDSTLDTLTSHLGARYTGYVHTRSSGKPGEQVYAIVLCPPVIKPEDCELCVKKTVPYLIQNCRNQKEGVAWASLSRSISCMVRYADSEIEGKYDLWGSGTFSSIDASAPPAYLSPAVLNYGKELAEKAIGLDASRKYASGRTMYGSDKRDIYMASQCTPDLSLDNCRQCLNNVGSALGKMTKLGKVRGVALNNNCYTMYDHVPISPTIYS